MQTTTPTLQNNLDNLILTSNMSNPQDDTVARTCAHEIDHTAQTSDTHATDGQLELLSETSKSTSHPTANEDCASGSCTRTDANDLTLAYQTKFQSLADGCRSNEAAQGPPQDTILIAARPSVHCQQLHLEDTASSSVKSHMHADVVIPPAGCAPRMTSLQERNKQRAAYNRAIRKEDVLKLVSSHNHGKECTEFRERDNGSFNVCFFVEFPSDGQKWVVRFPICPVLHEPWQKLQCEVATIEYIQVNTTIPVPRVYGHGPGGDLDSDNATGLPYLILEYIVGEPLDSKRLLSAPADVVHKFYAQLGDALAQLRAQEFEYTGSLAKDKQGFVLTSPRSLALNRFQADRPRSVSPRATAFDYAMCQYNTLEKRFSLPTENMGEAGAKHEVFALKDFKARLFQLMDPSLNFGPFVLTHGDLRPSNIIVSKDFTIQGIIDWEWSAIVPREFFLPPLWFGGREVSSPPDAQYISHYALFYQALLGAGATSDACRTLASEWGPDLGSNFRVVLPEVLLHRAFVDLYYLTLFPVFYKGQRRQDKIEAFFKSSRVFREVVRVKVEESRTFKDRLIADGVLNPDTRKKQDSELEALCLKEAQLFGSGTAAPQSAA